MDQIYTLLQYWRREDQDDESRTRQRKVGLGRYHTHEFHQITCGSGTPSKAGIGRVYSLTNKNKPEGSDRNRMDIDGTLASIIWVKLGRPECENKCYMYEPSEVALEAAKKATKLYNAEHRKR